MKQTGISKTEPALLIPDPGLTDNEAVPAGYIEENIRDPHVEAESGTRVLAGLSLENKLLSSLAESSLINLLPFMERVSFSNDQYVFRPESKVRHVYFPETSVVSEIQILEDGRTVEVAMSGRESAIGLPSIFDHNQSVNWTQVALPGTALKISIDILRELVERDGVLQMEFFKHISAYIKQITQRVVCHSYHSMEERFCTWLLMLHRMKPDVSLALTQEKMARSLGVHRPSLTPLAQLLRDKNVIAYTRGKLHITDSAKLKRYACPCHAY